MRVHAEAEGGRIAPRGRTGGKGSWLSAVFPPPLERWTQRSTQCAPRRGRHMQRGRCDSPRRRLGWLELFEPGMTGGLPEGKPPGAENEGAGSLGGVMLHGGTPGRDRTSTRLNQRNK